MKNGLSGAYARCLRSQATAWSARSSLRWYFSSCGGSIGLKILDQPRLPLRGLAGQEAVEVVEADPLAGGPQRERPHRRRVGRRRVVPLAEGGGLVTVSAQDLRNGRRGPGNHAGIAVPVHRAFRNRPGTHPLVVASGQQRRPRRRADRRGMEGVVADALVRDARQRGRMDRSAVGVGQAEADVVEQDDEDVGGILRQVALLHAPLVLRRLQRRAGHACRRCRRKRQHRAVGGLRGLAEGMGQQGAQGADECEIDFHSSPVGRVDSVAAR